MALLKGALAAALASGVSGCSGPGATPADDWQAQVVKGQLLRAQQQAAAGDRERARQLASAALAGAREAAQMPLMAQAQLLLGRLDGDSARLNESLDLYVLLDDEPGQSQARLALAELAVRAGQVDAALSYLAAATRELQDVPGTREERARAEAKVYHLHATALRLSGRRNEAASKERQARLALSVLRDVDVMRDSELLPLRISVSQSLGDDCAATFDYQQAVEQHAQACDLARRAGDRAGELAADESLGLDLQGLGRPDEAYGHCLRALRIAVELHDRERAASLLQRSQDILTSLGEGPGSPRWENLSATAAGAG